jgi:tetratricopeptide (TPR) repeat protein
MYERALVVDPQHANSLYNYGVMLDTHLKQKDEAEELYRRAIAAAPRHAFACYNLAVLLEERLERLDRSQAEQVQRYGKRGDDSDPGSHGFTRQERVREVVGMYHRACELSPGDATSLSDYGRFLASQTPLIEQATQALNAALEADPNCETALYHLGALQLNKLDDAPSAELLVRRLLHTSPSHMAGCQLLARLLVIPCKLTKASKDGLPDEALELYERVLSGLKEKEFGGSSPQPGHSFSKNLSLKETLLEYLGIVTSKGSNHQLLRVVTFLSSAQIDISAVDLEADRLLQGMKSTVLGKRN